MNAELIARLNAEADEIGGAAKTYLTSHRLFAPLRCAELLRAAAAALSTAPPREPTEAMIAAGRKVWLSCQRDGMGEHESAAGLIWYAMVDAAPQIPPTPTVAESHQRIVAGKGSPEDYRRVLGDPTQGVSWQIPPTPDREK